MKVWRISDGDYWGILPAGIDWAPRVAATAEQQEVKTSTHILGDPTDERSPAAALAEFPPNYVLARHSHGSDRIELVIAGSVEVDGEWLGPGDMWSSDANEYYGPHRMGPDGCTTLELMTVSGAHRLTFDGGGTDIHVDFTDPAALATATKYLAAD